MNGASEMDISFEVNQAGLDQLAAQLQPGLEDQVVTTYQAVVDRLGRDLVGQPAADVEPLLVWECAAIGVVLSDSEIVRIAALISDGTAIQVRVVPG